MVLLVGSIFSTTSPVTCALFGLQVLADEAIPPSSACAGNAEGMGDFRRDGVCLTKGDPLLVRTKRDRFVYCFCLHMVNISRKMMIIWAQGPATQP